MGKRIILSLMALVAISLGTIPVFAESTSIIANSDKSVYQTGDSMLISGTINELKMPVIALRIFDPNGVILSANNVEIDDDNTFSKVIFLDSPFYDESGTYSVTFDYGKESFELNFDIDNGTVSQETENIVDEIIPEIIFMDTSKQTYYDDEFVEITGQVSSIEESSVLVGIFDTFGMPAGFYFGEINSEKNFSVSFLAKSGVNFKTEGTYSAKAFYGDSEFEIKFDFSNDTPVILDEDISESTIEEPKINESIQEEIEEPEIITEPVQENNKTIKEKENTKNKKEIIPTSSEIKQKPKIVENKKSKQNDVEEPQVKQETDNLSVEDVALGIMLNQMVLNCDSSEYDDFLSYYDGMGPALMRLCKYNEALSFFDQELEETPDDLRILTNKGVALGKLGLYQESILYYDTALELDSKYFPALNNKANALTQLGFWDEAESIYQEALELYPGNNLLLENHNKAQIHMPKIKTPIQKTEQTFQQTTNNVVEKTISTVKDVNEQPSNVLEEIGAVFGTFSAMIFGFLK